MSAIVRFRAMWSIVLAGIVVLAAWSYARLSGSHNAAFRAAEQTADCRQWASSIESFRDRPATVPSGEPQAMEVTGRIARAARDIGLHDGDIDRIDPRPPYHFGETAYELHPTELLLRGVTMRQLVSLLHAMDAQVPGAPDQLPLQVKNLRLSAPDTASDRERWTAHVTLFQLVYAPRSSGAPDDATP